MSLDDLLKPAKWVDEQVLREYTRIRQRISPERLYKYTTMMSFGGYCVFGGGILSFSLPNYVNDSLAITLIASVHFDWSYNCDILEGKINEPVTDTTKTLDYPIEFYRSFNKIIRFPLLLIGGLSSGKGILDLVNYITTREPLGIETIGWISSGIGLALCASSIYLKDADPKLLDKAPFWKTAYAWAKEKVKSLAPEPQPLPQPVTLQTSANLEDYV